MDKPPSRLSDWPWVVVRVDCKLCARRGCYRLARLAYRFGPEMELERLLDHLASDCPWNRRGRDPRKYEVRCGVRFTDWDHRKPALDEPRQVRHHPSSAGDVRDWPRLSNLQATTVVVVCRPCGRRVVYSVERLKARFGADMLLGRMLSLLAADCPNRGGSMSRCAAVYEHLAGGPR